MGLGDRKDKEWIGWLASTGGDGKVLVWELEVIFLTLFDYDLNLFTGRNRTQKISKTLLQAHQSTS